MVLLGVIALLAVVLDRLAKLAVIKNMVLYESVPVIKNILNFTYVKNTGAAFSMFEQGNTMLAVLSVVIIAIVLWYIWYKKFSSKLVYIAAGMLLGGALGNFIDRILYGSVVDFIDVQFVQFAVFNVADCFVVVGCVLFGIHILLSGNGQEEKASVEEQAQPADECKAEEQGEQAADDEEV